MNTKASDKQRRFSGFPLTILPPLLSVPESFSPGMPVRGSIMIYSCSNKSQLESLESVIKSSESFTGMELCHVQSRKHLPFRKGHSNQTVRPQSLLSVFTLPLGFIFNSGMLQSVSHFNFTPPEILKKICSSSSHVHDFIITFNIFNRCESLTSGDVMPIKCQHPRWLIMPPMFISCLKKIVNTVCSKMWKTFRQIYADIQVKPNGSLFFFSFFFSPATWITSDIVQANFRKQNWSGMC